MYKAKYKSKFSFKLEISFIISLSLFVALFYLYPRFEIVFKSIADKSTPDFVIMATPRTIQTLKYAPSKPILPGIPVEADDVDLLDEIEVYQQTDVKSADTLVVLYYPELKYQNLFEPFDAASLRDPEEKDPLFQYKQYLAKRLEEMDFSGAFVFSSSELQNQLDKAEGKLPLVGIAIPINIATLFGGSSDHIYPERASYTLSVNNITAIHKKLDILETLWINGPQTILELFKSDSISMKNTYRSLQQSLDDLIINGFVERAKNTDGVYKFEPVYSHKEMIRIVAALRYSTALEQKIECEILADMLQQLLDLN
jgi:hypothetical protein